MARGRSRFKENTYGQFDPRAELKQKKAHAPVDTSLSQEQVTELGRKATEVYGMHLKDVHGEQQVIHDRVAAMLDKLSNRVDHDHMQGVVHGNADGQE